MNVKHQITVNASAERLWEILVEDYDQISGWASAVLESGPNPQVPVGDGRVCLTTVGRNTEVIKHKNKSEHTFTYIATPERQPFFLNGIENTFTLKSIGDNQTTVGMNAHVKLSGIVGSVMAPLMKRRMLKGFGGILEELKHYAETDEVHARKQVQVASQKPQTE